MSLMQQFLNYKYLTKEQLNGFNNYKFSPLWVAPNLMTFVGFLCTVINFMLLSYYDWNFYASANTEFSQPIPEWVWLTMAINIFLAYTLDGIDGKQARRISLSGPLGELFDHGLDSYTAVLIPTCLYSIFGRSIKYSIAPLRMYYVCWMVFFNFFISHWEKYNTGVLFLPWGYDLSMWGSTAVYLITWWFGYEFWKRDLPFGVPLGNCIEFLLHISAMSNIPMVIINVYNSYAQQTGKMRPFWEALRPLWPFVVFMTLLLWWPFISPNNIIEKDPRAFFMLSGTISSNISCRLIVSQMSNTRCDCFHWMIPIYMVCIGFGLWWPLFERFMLYLLLVMTTLSHWHYGTNVVNQMCEHFNRMCFSVEKRNEPLKKIPIKENGNSSHSADVITIPNASIETNVNVNLNVNVDIVSPMSLSSTISHQHKKD